MRILVHDYGGYAFPLELSQELGRRGHDVIHAYCASLQTTPPGVGKSANRTPDGIKLVPVSLGEPLNKYDFVKRWKQERRYGHLISREIERIRPELILSANTPLDAQKRLIKQAQKSGAKVIYWLQDVLGVATHRILKNKIPVAGSWIGKRYMSMERSLLRKSDAVIAITEDFHPLLEEYGVSSSHIHVIPNWAPLHSLPMRPKSNAWSNIADLANSFCFLYAGTLGMKHNPDLLLQLALSMQHQEHVRIVIISQGQGAQWLKEKKAEYNLSNLDIRPYQPVEDLHDVLAAGDVLIALLEKDAGLYSVPSKVTTYLCAGRPLLLGVPAQNKAARIVAEQRGFVVDPENTDQFVEAAHKLFSNTDLRAMLGANARRYAETHFDIQSIGNQFESIIMKFNKNL
ncbi:MAG: glycosyltransferase family 4 protein [Rhodothermaceae bacterium]|nr:glycosyltransferase family 4 protein [Rhodothermaceae bacterium]